jgi:c-di-GMP-binding flagellar brake protein YcgR
METKKEGKEGKARFGIANFERRRYPRFSVDLPIEYYRVNSTESHPGRTGNVSESGWMVYLGEKPEMGQFLKVKLFFPSAPDLHTIEMLAQVAWVDLHLGENKDYRTGVKFIDISPEDVNKLTSFLGNLSRI